MSQPYGQQPGDANQGYGAMPPAPAEYSSGPTTRPGTVTAAAVLDFVQAGITLISSILMMSLAGAVTSAKDESLAGVEVDEGMLALLWILTIGGVVGAGLLIWAGVKAMSGTAGNLMLIANGLQILLGVVWLVTGAVIALVFLVMPIIALVLSMQGPAKQFEASRRG
ncbi:hypothetical protein [Actinophytocola sp. KF-1]